MRWKIWTISICCLKEKTGIETSRGTPNTAMIGNQMVGVCHLPICINIYNSSKRLLPYFSSVVRRALKFKPKPRCTQVPVLFHWFQSLGYLYCVTNSCSFVQHDGRMQENLDVIYLLKCFYKDCIIVQLVCFFSPALLGNNCMITFIKIIMV